MEARGLRKWAIEMKISVSEVQLHNMSYVVNAIGPTFPHDATLPDKK